MSEIDPSLTRRNQSMSDNRFNTVVIIDSIPAGELNTARRLHEDLEVYKALPESTPGVVYEQVGSVQALEEFLAHLRAEVSRTNAYPLLHVEAHGSAEGLQLADGSTMTWECLKGPLVSLNTVMRLNLMLVLASCFGGTFVQTLDISDRAPVWGLIGPTREVEAGQLEADFGSFYRTLYSTSSPQLAIEKLNASASSKLYYRTTAKEFFYIVWSNYKNQHCSKTDLEIRARRMFKKAKREKLPRHPSVGGFKRLLSSKESKVFDIFRDQYFMCDLFPEHQERFGVTYDEAEARIRRQ